MFFDRLEYYHQFEQVLDRNNRKWWICELWLLIIQTGRFLFYVILSFMDESVIRSYCPYDTTAAPLFHYFTHLDDGTSLNLTDCRITSIIFLIFYIFVLHSQYTLFLTDHNSLTWHLLYDISNRNYDHFRDSFIYGKRMNMIKMAIQMLSNNNEHTLNSSSRIINDHRLAKMLKKNRKTFIDKFFIQLMLNINLHKFEKLSLKIFPYAGLMQRIALAMTMLTLHFMDVFLLILVISTTFTLGCLMYFDFIYIHMLNIWPLAIIDCINHLYCGYIFLRNCTLYFNFASISLVFYALQMNSLNRKLKKVFGNHRHMINLRLNYLRQLVWRQFQRRHQHIAYCIMYSGMEIWNGVFFMGIIANIPLNIMCIYNIVFKYNSLNNEFIYLGFIIFQTFVLSTAIVIVSEINFLAHQFKRQLPIMQFCMKEPSIKWQINEFHERLTTTENGFGFYCGRIAIINYHNSFQLLMSYFGFMLIMFKFFFNNNV
uniref:Uncharacterized protein LOC113794951 n=1 Tax=Dermatophagoides pteronyssinus TaxID=6956 RepID=A0A6P6Y615_DERPT|nr:uncharacterized protein LOC113794951 [Dermatophagoides pteronyssinus]